MRAPIADDKAMLRAARDLTKDLYEAKGAIYWPDMLLSAGTGYAAIAGAILTQDAALAVVLGVIGALALYRAFFETEPDATLMGSIAILALAANLASVVILMRWREGDANVRSVWLCSRNDAIGNVAVFGSAGLVALTGTHWPDVIVAAGMAGLFVWSATQILSRALAERRHAAAHAAPGE